MGPDGRWCTEADYLPAFLPATLSVRTQDLGGDKARFRIELNLRPAVLPGCANDTRLCAATVCCADVSSCQALMR